MDKNRTPNQPDNMDKNRTPSQPEKRTEPKDPQPKRALGENEPKVTTKADTQQQQPPRQAKE